MRLKHACPTCKKEVTEVKSQFPLGKLVSYTYQCGHIEFRTKFELSIETPSGTLIKDEEVSKLFDSEESKLFELEISRWDDESPASVNPPYGEIQFKSKKIIPELFWSKERVTEYFCDECKESHDRFHLFEFQRDGVRFGRQSNLNCLIADEMGLGKTPQAIKVLEDNQVNMLPCLIIVKGATLLNWSRELRRWSFNKFSDVMILKDRINFIPGFKVYVISMDLISRKGIKELLTKLNLRSVILDECQNFKDSSSKRTIALIELLSEAKIEAKVLLSGTPVKNRASEYFVPLNLLDPVNFTSYMHFCHQYLEFNEKGIPTKLNPYMEDSFFRKTKNIIIRREQKDVQKDLPELRIDYQLIEIEDEHIRKSYNSALDLFTNFLKNEARINSSQLLGWLAKLRHITGQAKVPNCVQFVRDFIESTEEQKIAIGIHHKGVRDTLKLIFDTDGIPTLTLSGEDDNYEKDRIAQSFNNGIARVLIINMLAGGVGLNLQGGNHFVALERTWNGADEDQFHKRFHRYGQKRKVHGTYLIAAGTIDEWYHDLIFSKRNNIASVGIGEGVDDTQSLSFLKEFSEFVASKRI